MYTVEFEKDAAVITVLAEDDSQEDIEVIVGGDDDTVWIRQYQEYKNEYDILCMTWQQLLDITAALNSPEGMFRVAREKGKSHD
jgi:hypothetical protein